MREMSLVLALENLESRLNLSTLGTLAPPASASAVRAMVLARLQSMPALRSQNLAFSAQNNSGSHRAVGAAVATPTAVTAIHVSSTLWTSSYLNTMASSGLGSATLGYEVPTGSGAQFSTLGWANLNQISITFSQNVTLGQNALQLTGYNVPSYGIANFSYNATNHTATWTFAGGFPADNLLITLSAGAVTDGNGNALDGEWIDGLSTNSGNGTPGGNFTFHLNVLPGDVNGDGVVDINDQAMLGSHWQQSANSPLQGDFNGDGVDDINDEAIFAASWQRSVTVPLAPTNLSLSNTGSSGLTLNWTDNALNQTSSTVFRSTDDVNFAPVATVSTGTDSYSDSNLAAGTTYFYRVAANFNDDAGSASSSTLSFATPTPAPIANPITLSTQNMTSFTELDINGTTVSDNILVTQSNNVLYITGNGQTTSVANTFGDIVIHGFNGNDTITVDSSVNIATLIYGGDGNDTIVNQTTGKATIVTIGNGVNTVTGNGVNTSYWVNANDTVNASATEIANGAVNRVANWYQPVNGSVSRGLYGQNLPDPTDSGSEYLLTANSFWGTGPSMSDINQGQVADCYYLAPLASLANNETVKFMNTGVDLGDGTYAVRFERGGVTTYVRVDGDISANGYAHPGASGNMWGLIYEKAYAFFRSGAATYSSLNYGYQNSSFSDLGFNNVTINATSSTTQILSTINNALNSGHALAADTHTVITGSDPIVASHNYSVIGAWIDSTGTLQIELRNPWGFNPGADGILTIDYATFAANFYALTYTTT